MNKKYLIILLVCLLLTGCKKQTKPQDDPKPDNPVINETENVRFDKVSETVYNLESLTYQFAIVKVRIKNDAPVQYQLSDFETDEGVKLDKTDRYMDELNRMGIALSKQNVSTKIESKDNSAIFTLFVPVSAKTAKSVKITFLNKYAIEVDLTKNLGTEEQLGMANSEEVIINEDDYTITVKRIYDATGEALFESGEAVSYPSTAEIYGIQLEMTTLGSDDVVIEEAEYITNESNTFIALGKEYEGTEKTTNILGVQVKGTKTGYLLFQVLNPDRENVTYKGTLRLKINGQWHNVSVDL